MDDYSLTTFNAECVGAGDDVADEEDGVEDAQRDEQLVEGALHLGAPEDENGENVTQHPEPAEDRGHKASQPPFPSYQNLEEKQHKLKKTIWILHSQPSYLS